MSCLAPKPKITKRRGSQLEVRVRATRPREVVGACPWNCNSLNALRISFFTHTVKRYLDSSSSSLVGAETETTGQKNLCGDKRLFFCGSDGATEYYDSIRQVLGSLNVKECLHDKIATQIMSMGDWKYKGGEKVRKRKIYGGLIVDLTSIHTFFSDRDTVRELFEKSMEECGMEPSDKGVHFVL